MSIPSDLKAHFEATIQRFQESARARDAAVASHTAACEHAIKLLRLLGKHGFRSFVPGWPSNPAAPSATPPDPEEVEMLLEDYGLMKVGRDLLSDRDDIEHVQKYVLIGVSGDKVFALPYDEEEGVLCRSDEDSYTDEDWYTEDEDIDEDLNFEVDDESERQPEVVSFFIDECLFSSDDDYHNAKALRAILDEPHRVIAPE